MRHAACSESRRLLFIATRSVIRSVVARSALLETLDAIGLGSRGVAGRLPAAAGVRFLSIMPLEAVSAGVLALLPAADFEDARSLTGIAPATVSRSVATSLRHVAMFASRGQQTVESVRDNVEAVSGLLASGRMDMFVSAA